MKLGKQSPAEMKSLNINDILNDLLKALGTLGHIKYLDDTTGDETSRLTNIYTSAGREMVKVVPSR